MRTFQMIIGILFALTALFIGGCSLFFGAMFLAESGSGGEDYGFWVIPLAGVIVAPFLALGAWLLLRKTDDVAALSAEETAARVSGGRVFGGVICALIALYLAIQAAFLFYWSREFDMDAYLLPQLAAYLVLAAVAGWGAYRLLRRRAPPEG